jgi:hypothetical protein
LNNWSVLLQRRTNGRVPVAVMIKGRVQGVGGRVCAVGQKLFSCSRRGWWEAIIKIVLGRLVGIGQ